MRPGTAAIVALCRRSRACRAVGAAFLSALLAAAVLAVALTEVLDARRSRATVEVADAGELAALFAAHGYVAVPGERQPVAVPRLLLASLPADLASVAAPAERKALFLRAVLPLVLAVNEEIAADRAQLLALDLALKAGRAPTPEQAGWLAAVAERYGVKPGDDLAADIAELLLRVDVVPPSLALAQAALESGWGTSRLAREGNALFGERTWKAAGLVPLAPAPGATHRARSFAELYDAVAAYVGNLNTHPAYAEFRSARAKARAAGAPPEGIALVHHLTRYSELGPAYTQAVGGLIRSNGLQALDRAEFVAEDRTA